MDMGQFAWVGLHEELADPLLGYANDRRSLLRHLSNTYAQAEIPLPTIDRTSNPEDIDSFTVFGLFTRGITNAKRITILDALAQEFGISAARPVTFNGVPGINNLAAFFTLSTAKLARRISKTSGASLKPGSRWPTTVLHQSGQPQPIAFDQAKEKSSMG